MPTTTRRILANTDVKFKSPFGDPGSPRDRVWEPAETIVMSNAIDSLGKQGTHCPGSRTFEQCFTYFLKLMPDGMLAQTLKRMTTKGFILRPLPSLASCTCTDEGIYDGVAFARVVLARLVVLLPPRKRWDSKLCERDETRCEAKQKEGNSLP